MWNQYRRYVDDEHAYFKFSVIIVAAEYYYARKTLMPAHEAGLTNGDYVFILFELDLDEVLLANKYPSYWFAVPTLQEDPYYRCKFQQAFDSVLLLALNVNENDNAFHQFQSDVKERSPDPPFNSDAYQQFQTEVSDY